MATTVRHHAFSSEYERLERATEGIEAPFALVDLDAMWANSDDMLRRAAGKPIRVASKSVRCTAGAGADPGARIRATAGC